MTSPRISRVWGTILLTITIFSLSLPAYAKYSGGTGEPNNPYQIATAEDLMLLGETPEDYDKHFILTADIDLDPNLPGRKVFDKAVIGSLGGTFDGCGHTISHLTISGGRYLGLFGELAGNAEVRNLGVVDVNIIGSGDCVGGLVGNNGWSVNRNATVTRCYSTGSVCGKDSVGGLTGWNSGTVSQCYSTAHVSGSHWIGGLVGGNDGAVTYCYSAGPVKGCALVGGLAAGFKISMGPGAVSGCWWDTQTSGQAESAGGYGRTTAQMSDINTFLGAGWDFVGETTNGTSQIWQMPEGGGYPVLAIFCGYTPPRLQGLGTPHDPYLIGNAMELGAIVYYSPHAHYRLAASIDLSGITRWSTAVIPRLVGTFDGCGHTISHLAIPTGTYLGLFGRLESGAEVKGLAVVDVEIDGTNLYLGAVVGYNEGTVNQCYSTGSVTGLRSSGGVVGGLVGRNSGIVSQCYSTARVNGPFSVGGLVGSNDGAVIHCYSAGMVSGRDEKASFIGGLVGQNVEGGMVTQCFWDIQTSGQTTSAGGTGKTTAEMQTAATFLEAGWHFVGETHNGTEDAWVTIRGRGYPSLMWELSASSPEPQNCAVDVILPPILNWQGAPRAIWHDVYFGEDRDVVADSTPGSPGIYRGRQAAQATAYDPGALKSGKTYYWRIDEVNQVARYSRWQGDVWSFTTVDSSVVNIVDDFESYTDDEGRRIWETWIDGWGFASSDASNPGNGTGAMVGCNNPPYAERTIVHSGRQSMPVDYNNVSEPWYSEAEQSWETPQDCAIDGADALTLYFRGQVGNTQDRLYVVIGDSAHRVAVVTHPDMEAVLATKWQRWQIPLADLRASGVDVTAVKKMAIGVVDSNSPKPGGTGKIYIDDIRLTKRVL